VIRPSSGGACGALPWPWPAAPSDGQAGHELGEGQNFFEVFYGRQRPKPTPVLEAASAQKAGAPPRPRSGRIPRFLPRKLLVWVVILPLWEAFLIQMNDFDRFLEFELRQMLDPLVTSETPRRRRRLGRQRTVPDGAQGPLDLAVEPWSSPWRSP